MNDCERTKDLEKRLKEIQQELADLKEQRCGLPKGVERINLAPNFGWCETRVRCIKDGDEYTAAGIGKGAGKAGNIFIYQNTTKTDGTLHKPPAARIFATDMLRMCDEVEGVEGADGPAEDVAIVPIQRRDGLLVIDGYRFSDDNITRLLTAIRRRFPVEYLDVLEKEVTK